MFGIQVKNALRVAMVMLLIQPVYGQELRQVKGLALDRMRMALEPEAMQSQLQRWMEYSTFEGAVDQGRWHELGPLVPPESRGPQSGSYSRIRGVGRIFSVEFHEGRPDWVWATSPTGGLFVSEDRGAHWRNGGTDFLPNPGASHVLPHPHDPDVWYLATGDADDGFSFSYGIFRTVDAGQTWQNISGSPPNGLAITDLNRSWSPVYYRKLAFNPGRPHELFAAGTAGIYRTQNAQAAAGEVKWQRVLDGVFYDVVPVPGTRGQEWIAGGEEVYWSQDGGERWKILPGLNESVYASVRGKRKRTTVRISPDNPNIIYLSLTADDGEGSTRFDAHLLVFDRARQQFTHLGELPQEVGAQRRMGAGRAQSFAVNPRNHMEVLLGNVTNVYRSIDGGLTFDRLAKDFHDDLHWIAYHPVRNEIWIGTDGGVSMSSDSGATWQERITGLGVLNAFNLALGEFQGGVGYGGYDVGCNFREPGDVFRLESFGDGFELAIDDRPDSVTYVYSSVNGGVFRRKNQERAVSITPSRSLTGNVWKRHFVLDSGDPSKIYMAGKNVLCSEDRGDTWRDLGPLDGTVWEVFASPAHPHVVYATTVHPFGVYRCMDTRDAEPQWEFFESSFWVEDVFISGLDPAVFARATGRYESANAQGRIPKVEIWTGNRWEDWTGLSRGDAALEGLKVFEVVLDGNGAERMYVGTNAGVYAKEHADGWWQKIPGLPHAAVQDLEVDAWEGKLYAATYGRGIWWTDLFPDESIEWIRSDVEWTSPRMLLGKVVVKSGHTLTISDEVWVGNRARIIVQPGAELVLDGGSIRYPERISWNGIQQVPATRKKPAGSVKLKNGGRIQE